jgi:hypothetical protein
MLSGLIALIRGRRRRRTCNAEHGQSSGDIKKGLREGRKLIRRLSSFLRGEVRVVCELKDFVVEHGQCYFPEDVRRDIEVWEELFKTQHRALDWENPILLDTLCSLRSGYVKSACGTMPSE